MPSLSDVDIEVVRERLTPARGRQFQVIHVAIVASIMVFLTINFFLYGLGDESPPNDGDTGMMNTLLIALAVEAFGALAAVRVITGASFSRARLDQAGEPAQSQVELAELALAHIFRFRLVRLALFESVGLFGLVITMLGIRSGTLFHHPEYIASIVPACLFLIFLAVSFPTLEAIANDVRRRIIDRAN